MTEPENVRILYVEDDSGARTLLRRMLRNEFAEIIMAENGLEGYEAFKLVRPDIVITDIQMPVMDGLEMIEKIYGECKEMPIIVTTAYDDEAHKSQKACITMVKPIEKDLLVDAIRECLRKKSKGPSS
ncbi:MAG TPA: response regulator [Nitrospirota bacterium]